MAVITISRQFGSGGDEIAEQVCRALDYHFFDKSLITLTAMKSGLNPQDVVDFSEDNHKVQTFLDRLFGSSNTFSLSRTGWPGVEDNLAMDAHFFTEEDALNLTQKSVVTAYESGNFVIVGRGGQILLKDLPNTLHIRVEAPFEERIQRVKQWLKREKGMAFDTIETRRAAQDLIATRDAASTDYLRRYYGIDWSDPLLYHIVINTGKLEIDQAVRYIVELAGMTIHEPAMALNHSLP